MQMPFSVDSGDVTMVLLCACGTRINCLADVNLTCTYRSFDCYTYEEGRLDLALNRERSQAYKTIRGVTSTKPSAIPHHSHENRSA